MNQSSMLSHRTQKNPNLEMIQEMAEVDVINRPFVDRYNDETGIPYNSVQIDRGCASCKGNAPQILSMLKIACLNYVNSPIEYGPVGNKLKLSFPEVLQVKEFLLVKI